MHQLFLVFYDFRFFASDVKKEKQPSSPDDVIVLSDNEPSSPRMNGGSHFKELDTDLLMVRTITSHYNTVGLFIRSAIQIYC